jgi:hypothetical protein
MQLLWWVKNIANGIRNILLDIKYLKDWGIEVLGPASFLIPLGVVMSIFGATNGTVFTSGR